MKFSKTKFQDFFRRFSKSAKKGKLIKAQAEQKVIMHFSFDTNFAEQAKKNLMAKCPNGEIKNIMTRYSTSHGFFHWTNKLVMQGRCFN